MPSENERRVLREFAARESAMLATMGYTPEKEIGTVTLFDPEPSKLVDVICAATDPHFGTCVDSKGHAGMHINAAGRSFMGDLPVRDPQHVSEQQKRMAAHENSKRAHGASDSTRPSARKRVLSYLTAEKGSWVPGHVLMLPEVGGAEGKRRVRELRAAGHPIESRMIAGSVEWEYRLP